MTDAVAQFLEGAPLLALFLTIICGYVIGKFRVKTFVLGGIAGSLIMGVLIGQMNIHISPAIGSIFFALFIYVVGYQGGAQFFRSLNRKTLVQLISATLTCVLGLICTLIAAWVYHLDRGTAAGIAAGGLTQSAMIGTASAAIGNLPLSLAQIHKMQSNVAVGYAICYIFGSFGPILMLSAVFPSIMRWNLREEARKLADDAATGSAALNPGEYSAIRSFDTRVYQITQDSGAIGRSAADIFEHDNHMAIEALIRNNQLVSITPDIVLKENDIVAVTAQSKDFTKNTKIFTKEIAKPDLMQATEETRQIILTNKAFEGVTLREFFNKTDVKEHYGVFVDSISRLGENITLDMNTTLKCGDDISFVGKPSDLNRLTKKMGHAISAAKITDFIFFGLGMAIGILIGMISIPIHGVSVALGTGTGCLFSGLIFGWLHSRHPQYATLPVGAGNFLRDFGLAVFVAVIGLTAGPQAVSTIKKFGMELFFLGVGVTLIPQILTFYISYYWLKIKNPITLLATIAGGRSANPALAAILEKAGNATPVLSFTAAYAIANIWLTLFGPVIVAIITKNVS